MSDTTINRRALLHLVGVGGVALALPGSARADIQNKGFLFFNLSDYGAQGDGKTLDTRAWQAAIDACAAAGGGTVVAPAGVYLSGTIVLKSKVTVWLQSGAVLLGSTDLKDYPPKVPAFRSYTGINYVERSLIYAERVQDIAILGPGIIHGQGEAPSFQLPGGPHYKQRPFLVRMTECQRVTVRDVVLLNSPMWVQHYLACDDVLLDGLTVHSLVNRNNDGIDLDCCQRVRVANCNITSGDDAIVLKSTAPRPCRAITITNCRLSSLCNALKCGTESTGGFQDIVINNCVVEDTRLCGIALEAVDGGDLDGIHVSNIRLIRTRGGIFLRLGNRARPYLAEGLGGSKGTFTAPDDQPGPGIAAFRNVCIAQVTGEGMNNIGCAVAGLRGHPLENITLEGIQFTFDGGGAAENVQRPIPEQEAAYPEFKMFGRLSAYGFFCRHVNGLRLRDIEVGTVKSDARPGLVCDQVTRLEVRGWQARTAPPGGPEILLRDVTDAWIHGGRPVANSQLYARIAGKDSRQIRFSNNLCPDRSRLFSTDPEVSEGTAVNGI
jgi:hypothetical protein